MTLIAIGFTQSNVKVFIYLFIILPIYLLGLIYWRLKMHSL